MNPIKMFFTADLHFGHRAMPYRFRKIFRDVEDHDESLIYEWNKTVPADGHVFILGDFSFSGTARTMEILDRLNGRLYLVSGNHDRGMSATVKDRFEWVKPYHEQKVPYDDGQVRLVMGHFPFLSWHNMHHGSYNLHGHCHDNLSKPMKRQLDVGVDTARRILRAYRPWSFTEIHSLLSEEGVEQVDHHDARKAFEAL